MTTTEATLVTPTRTLYLYGKNGKAQGPTKAYPHTTLVKLEAVFIKDFGDGIAVWKFPAYKDIQPEKFWVYHHHKNGEVGSGGECESKEAAFDRAERDLVWREYNARKKELYQEHRENLERLEEEFKGRI